MANVLLRTVGGVMVGIYELTQVFIIAFAAGALGYTEFRGTIHKFGTISVTLSHKAAQRGKFAKGGTFIGELVTVRGKRRALKNITRKDNLS